MTGRYDLTSGAATAWKQFCEDARAWKPEGYDREMALRLAYFLDQQVEDTKALLKARFPKTHETMQPVTLPITRHFVREQAKVFLATTKLDLVKDGAPLAGETDEGGNERPNPTVAWWEKAKERMGLALRLKKTDAYTTLFRTAALRFAWDPVAGRLTAHVVFPQSVRVVLDPAAPMDIDRAHLVAVEIASESGLKTDGARRWECWCAREGEEAHFIVREKGEGAVEVEWRDDGGPLVGPDDRAMVPLVFFTAHTEELGLFTLEGSDLVQANRGLNLLVTDIHHIAEQQGFGVMVVTAGQGGGAPGEIVRAPNRAIELKDGADAKFIDPNAPIGALLDLADRRIKQAAVLYGIPAGSVSIEARAAASGIALQIENRPLYELRADAIEVYREPMRRAWNVIRALWGAYSDQAEEVEVGDLADVDLRWTPGEIQVPTDDGARTDTALAKMKARLQSRAETIAELRGISVEEAKKVIAEIDEADAPESMDGAEDDDPMGLKAKRDELAGAPAAPIPTAEEAAAAGVVQDTAMNGAQVSSLLEIVQAAADKNLPLESVRALVEAAFPAVSPDLIARILSPLKAFQAKPDPVPPKANPFPPKPEEPAPPVPAP